jgi:hypothetical protein
MVYPVVKILNQERFISIKIETLLYVTFEVLQSFLKEKKNI